MFAYESLLLSFRRWDVAWRALAESYAHQNFVADESLSPKLVGDECFGGELQKASGAKIDNWHVNLLGRLTAALPTDSQRGVNPLLIRGFFVF